MKKYIPYLIGLTAFIYLGSLAVKEYAFVFISSDSGDFLAASTIWMVPQVYGYPLYILLGHLLNTTQDGDLAAKMTVVLSALPAAITVMMVYVIVYRLTGKISVAVICSAILLGTAVFLTEATITKGYALLGMFLTLAFYAYISEWKYRTVTLLALAATVHMIALTIAFFWFLADRRWKWWLNWKPLLLYCVIAFVPYVMVPILMYLDTPRLLAGSLSLINVVGYFSGTSRAIIGQLSVFEAPSRFLHIGGIILMSFGLALVSLFYVKYKPLTRPLAVLLGTVLFIMWYVITCLDTQTWTYMSLMAPSLVILMGLGLARMNRLHFAYIGSCVVMLICLNAVFLNAQKLETQDPQGAVLFDSLNSLPNKTTIVAEPGPYDLGLFYVMAKGKQLTPIIYPYLENWADFGMQGYDIYLQKFGLIGKSTLDDVQQSLFENRPTYFIPTDGSPLTRCFVLQDTPQQGKLDKIVALSGLQPDTYIRDVKRGRLGE